MVLRDLESTTETFEDLSTRVIQVKNIQKQLVSFKLQPSTSKLKPSLFCQIKMAYLFKVSGEDLHVPRLSLILSKGKDLSAIPFYVTLLA